MNEDIRRPARCRASEMRKALIITLFIKDRYLTFVKVLYSVRNMTALIINNNK